MSGSSKKAMGCSARNVAKALSITSGGSVQKSKFERSILSTGVCDDSMAEA